MLGTGTQASPFIIQTPQDVDAIRNNLSAYYELGNDIDMSMWGNFSPIAPTSAVRFDGFIDGKGNKILNLSIISTLDATGFIGWSRGDITGCYIKNLGLENVYVESTGNYTAGLIARNYFVNVSNCYVTGTVKCTNTTKFYVGGLLGDVQDAVVENCYSQCSVSGGRRVGGFVGYAVGTSTRITNSYSGGSVSGASEVGSFYGLRNVSVGYQPTFSNNFFDSQISGTTNYQSAGVTAKTTAQMKSQSTFVNWDFSSVWSINGSYPYLKVPAIPSQKITVTLNSHSSIANQFVEVSKRVVRVNVSHTNQIDSSHALELIKHANVMSHIEQIVSNVTVLKNANVKSYEVTSFIDKVGSEVTRIVTTQRLVQSHVNPINSIIILDIPIRIEKPVFAEVFICGNQSNMEHQLNQTQLENKVTQTKLNQITNQSNIFTIENRTEMEVN